MGVFYCTDEPRPIALEFKAFWAKRCFFHWDTHKRDCEIWLCSVVFPPLFGCCDITTFWSPNSNAQPWPPAGRGVCRTIMWPENTHWIWNCHAVRATFRISTCRRKDLLQKLMGTELGHDRYFILYNVPVEMSPYRRTGARA